MNSTIDRDTLGEDGQDMPGVDNPDYAVPTRPTETGYGASITDVQRGYTGEPLDDSDGRTGGMLMPETPEGFLWRGRLAIDR